MNKKEFQQLLQKYKAGTCTPQEEAWIEAWFKSMEIADNKSIDASENAVVKARSWSRLSKHITPAQSPSTIHPAFRIRYRHAWAVAAVVLLLLVPIVFIVVHDNASNELPIALWQTEKTIANNTGKPMKVILPDSSSVTLQPKSSLAFNTPFEKSVRCVTLEGEAFFAVKRDTLSPFVVTANEVVTRVLGTSFNISAFTKNEHVTVEVMTGKVSVTTKNGHNAIEPVEETILTPNQKIVYNTLNHEVSRTIVNDPMPIRTVAAGKRVHFEASPVTEIFKGLEQVYGVDIVFDPYTVSGCSLTTSIGEGSIHTRLAIICSAIDARYTVEENRIIITGNGCR